MLLSLCDCLCVSVCLRRHAACAVTSVDSDCVCDQLFHQLLFTVSPLDFPPVLPKGHKAGPADKTLLCVLLYKYRPALPPWQKRLSSCHLSYVHIFCRLQLTSGPVAKNNFFTMKAVLLRGRPKHLRSISVHRRCQILKNFSLSVKLCKQRIKDDS